MFNGAGKFNDYEYYVQLEHNAKSVVHPVRKIALTLLRWIRERT